MCGPATALGVATGVLIDDTLCQKLKLSRSMYTYGMKVAAVSILCQDPRVWDAMTDAGTPCPAQGLIGAEAASYWSDNPDKNDVPLHTHLRYTLSRTPTLSSPTTNSLIPPFSQVRPLSFRYIPVLRLPP